MNTRILAELADIESRSGEKGVMETRRAANVLLQRQFLFAGDRKSSHAYEVLTSGRFRGYFAALFDALGYEFRWQEHEQWVGLLPDPGLDGLPKVRVEPTLVLLVLALIWQEEVNRGGAGARAVVTTTVNTAYDRYQDVAGRNRKATLSVARFKEMLDELGRRSLVFLGKYDSEEQDHQIDIRPMVHLLVQGNALDRLESFLAEAEGAIERPDERYADMDEEEERT